jgi:hypothetical protein
VGLTAPPAAATDLAGGRGGTDRWLTTRALLPLALASFGGPLALAALYAPAAVADVTGAAGLVVVAATLGFLAPLAIWLRYSRDIASAGGLFAFVEAAAGRPVAVAQGAVWVGSYLLYLLYTSAYVVGDILPSAWPGAVHWQSTLDILLPIAVAAVVLAGRRAAVATIGVIGVGQVAVMALLDGVSVAHAPSASAFHVAASPRVGTATAGVATLFVCGSLPLFLGGETSERGDAFRRVLPIGLAVTAVGVLLAVYPLAADPAFARAPVPGVALTEVDVGHPAAVVVGVGVAASVVGLMALEYVALTRVLHAVTGAQPMTWARRLAMPLVLAGPVSVAVGADTFYSSLLRPSLVMLWVAQIVVVAVFPRFVRRSGAQLRPWHLVATVVAVALMTYALVTTVRGSGGT